MPCNSQTIWVVVLVESGIPTLVEAYPTEEDATIREQSLRDAVNFDYDETGVFEVKIGMESIQATGHSTRLSKRILKDEDGVRIGLRVHTQRSTMSKAINWTVRSRALFARWIL